MAKVNITLLTIKQRKDGSSPIVVRITQGNTRNYIFLTYYALPDQWVEDPPRVNSQHPDQEQINEVLEAKEKLIKNILTEFDSKNNQFSLPLFKQKFEATKIEDITMAEYMEGKLKQIRAAERMGTAAAVRDSLSSLKSFRGGDRILLRDLNGGFLDRYKRHLKDRKIEKGFKKGQKLSDRSISVYLRTLRSIYNQAVKEGYVEESLNPFGPKNSSKFSVDSDLDLKTRKRAIKEEEIELIYNYSGEHKLARDMFMFSYFAGGINFADLSFLKWSDITRGGVNYKRRKTHKLVYFEITEDLQDILDDYKGQGEYIFPVLLIHHDTEEKKHHRIKTALKKVNKELRLIGEELGIDAYLTFYVARHTLASELFWKKGASAGDVMNLFGHSDLATTQIYLKELNPEEVGKVQRKVGFKNNAV